MRHCLWCICCYNLSDEIVFYHMTPSLFNVIQLLLKSLYSHVLYSPRSRMWKLVEIWARWDSLRAKSYSRNIKMLAYLHFLNLLRESLYKRTTYTRSYMQGIPRADKCSLLQLPIRFYSFKLQIWVISSQFLSFMLLVVWHCAFMLWCIMHLCICFLLLFIILCRKSFNFDRHFNIKRSSFLVQGL